MPNHHGNDRLSWGDALFLYLEREGMPLNIASVSIFEGAVSLEDCQQFIESKLPLIPRYLQRVVAPPFNIGLPTWEFDPKFDVRNHVRQIPLRRGTEAEFKDVVGKILSATMDRQRPLWDMTLVSGLKGNRTGVMTRVHHCLADGISGVGLMNVIMDQNPEAPVIPRKRPRLRRPPRKDALSSLVELWVNSCSSIVNRVLLTQSEVLDMAEKIVAGGSELPAGELLQMLPEITSPTERLFFNNTYRGPQKFAWTEIPMAEIKAVREVSGAKHNDVILALVTTTIRRYAEAHGDVVKGRLLRLMVPVNVRNGDRPGELGNRISLLPVTVPLDIRNPKKLLLAVHQRMEFLKRAHVAELIGLAGGLLSAAPTSLQALVGPFASRLPVTPFNLVCTNVPGPQFPLYLLGHKMVHWYPYVPVGGDMALNCAILSYNGNSYFGFSGDVHAAPHLSTLEKYLQLSFAELKQAFHLKRPRKPGKPRTRKPKPEAKPVASEKVAAPPVITLVKPASAQLPTMPIGKIPAAAAAD